MIMIEFSAQSSSSLSSDDDYDVAWKDCSSGIHQLFDDDVDVDDDDIDDYKEDDDDEESSGDWIVESNLPGEGKSVHHDYYYHDHYD